MEENMKKLPETTQFFEYCGIIIMIVKFLRKFREIRKNHSIIITSRDLV